ncbi:MAG TPA: hypothetical protein VEB59_11955 [Gemmatimonadales bacterium]|nr:hypothetical protein [Gemmatimonadales bacterium]
MRHKHRTIPWQGELFYFQRMTEESGEYVWAVSRRGEFIGTMPAVANETTKDFDIRSLDWVADLLRA